MTVPKSATRVKHKFGFWRGTRVHVCADHYTVQRKWFWSKDAADRWAHNWMTYAWILCHRKANGLTE